MESFRGVVDVSVGLEDSENALEQKREDTAEEDLDRALVQRGLEALWTILWEMETRCWIV